MSAGEHGEPLALAAAEPRFVDLFPELEDGADLGVVEYFPPGPPKAVDRAGNVAPGAA
jgi:hypothetical protein